MTWLRSLAFAAALPLASCSTLGSAPTAKIGHSKLQTPDGIPAGTAVLTAAGDKVSITVTAAGLPEGPHGLHIHAVGKCEAPGFVSAGPHLNPDSHQHGSANPRGSHLGDLPNIEIGQNRTGTITAEIKGNRAEVEAWLFDADGSAVVIHAAQDDYRTDPTGNSGPRIACGIIGR